MTFNHNSAGLRKYVTQLDQTELLKLFFLFPVLPSET